MASLRLMPTSAGVCPRGIPVKNAYRRTSAGSDGGFSVPGWQSRDFVAKNDDFDSRIIVCGNQGSGSGRRRRRRRRRDGCLESAKPGVGSGHMRSGDVAVKSAYGLRGGSCGVYGGRSLDCCFNSSTRTGGAAGLQRRGHLCFSGPRLIAWGECLRSPVVHRQGSEFLPGKGGGSAIGAVAFEEPPVADDAEAKAEEKAEEKTEYNWRTEWYPLYLKSEVPRDAPLALSVYDHNLVLFYDGQGQLNCLEDHCPHRAAKLSDGQIMDGTLECLYHGWQFNGDGACVKIPQLTSGASIPKLACARSFAIKESQGVVWVWMADKNRADESKLPWFEHYAKEGFIDISAIHDFPYDHSVLVENLMDPAHVHISHDRTDPTARREKAEALSFNVTERNARGFAVEMKPASSKIAYHYRFQAPCIISNNLAVVDKDGKTQYRSACFLIRPTGQGKSSVIIRFGSTARAGGFGNVLIPKWIPHMLATKVFEQDMIFLAAQNETLIRRNAPTEDVYLNLRSTDTMVMEYRKWLDKVGSGMPYYFGHKSMSPAPVAAVQERAPAGLEAFSASTQPSKGAFGHVYLRDTTNRYFRHIVHCKSCRNSLDNFRKSQKVSLVLAILSTAVAIMLSNPKWKAVLVALALSLAGLSWASSQLADFMTQNFIRPHKLS